MNYDLSSAEKLGFQVLDQCHFLFFPDKWLEMLADYSKNDFMTLIYLYRNGEATMTDIAGYINAPLNTATGVVGRLEKKGVISRQRSSEDRRVVTVVLTGKGLMEIKEGLNEINSIFTEIMGVVDRNDIDSVLRVLDKVIEILNLRRNKEATKKVNKINIE